MLLTAHKLLHLAISNFHPQDTLQVSHKLGRGESSLGQHCGMEHRKFQDSIAVRHHLSRLHVSHLKQSSILMQQMLSLIQPKNYFSGFWEKFSE